MYGLLKTSYANATNEIIVASTKEKVSERAKQYMLIAIENMKEDQLFHVNPDLLSLYKDIKEFIEDNLIEMAFAPFFQFTNALMLGVDLKIVEVMIEVDA